MPLLLWWLPLGFVALAAVLARRPAPLPSGSTPRRGALAALAITAGAIGWAATRHGDARLIALLLATVSGAVAVTLAWGARGSARRAARTVAIIGGALIAAGLLPLLLWIGPALARAHHAFGPLDVVIVFGLLLLAGAGTAMLIAAGRPTPRR